MRNRCKVVCVGLGLGVAVATARPASAQAWLPPKGEAGFAFAYQYTYVHDHAFSNGELQDRGHIFANIFTGDLSYGITDRFAFRVRLPYVSSRYEVAGVGKPHKLPIDDGTSHPTFQDFHFELRFMATRGSLIVTPFAGYLLPSHDYEFFAHSAVGRHLQEFQIGTYLGRRLDPVLPDAYTQVSYGFSYVEQVIPGIRPNRSDLNFEVGYFVTPRLTLRVLGAAAWTHAGIGIPIATPLPKTLFLHHDQIGKVSDFNGGVGAAFAVTGSTDVVATVFQTLAAKNGHRIKLGISVGASVGFSPRRILRKMIHGGETAGS